AGDLRARLVEHVDLGDRKARRFDQVDDRPSEVTPAGDTLLNRVEASLPPAHALVRSQPVLEEVQLPAGLEHPAQLSERGGYVWPGAHRPGGQHGVVAVVGERKRLAVES